jgi:hypothetical protein
LQRTSSSAFAASEPGTFIRDPSVTQFFDNPRIPTLRRELSQ